MADKEDDLWGDSIPQKEVLDPVTILTQQIGPLEIRTKGELGGQITVIEGKEDTKIVFDVVAKKLAGRRVTLLEATTEKGENYPLILKSKGLSPNEIPPRSLLYAHEDHLETYRTGIAIALDETNFSELVKIVLRSDPTRSAIQSLLAQITGLKREKNSSVVYMQAS